MLHGGRGLAVYVVANNKYILTKDDYSACFHSACFMGW